MQINNVSHLSFKELILVSKGLAEKLQPKRVEHSKICSVCEGWTEKIKIGQSPKEKEWLKPWLSAADLLFDIENVSKEQALETVTTAPVETEEPVVAEKTADMDTVSSTKMFIEEMLSGLQDFLHKTLPRVGFGASPSKSFKEGSCLSDKITWSLKKEDNKDIILRIGTDIKELAGTKMAIVVPREFRKEFTISKKLKAKVIFTSEEQKYLYKDWQIHCLFKKSDEQALVEIFSKDLESMVKGYWGDQELLKQEAKSGFCEGVRTFDRGRLPENVPSQDQEAMQPVWKYASKRARGHVRDYIRRQVYNFTDTEWKYIKKIKIIYMKVLQEQGEFGLEMNMLKEIKKRNEEESFLPKDFENYEKFVGIFQKFWLSQGSIGTKGTKDIEEIEKPESLIIEPVHKEWAREILEKLGPRDQEMIYRSYWMEQSHPEIGKAIGVNDNTSKQVRSRCLLKLRKILQRYPTTDNLEIAKVLLDILQQDYEIINKLNALNLRLEAFIELEQDWSNKKGERDAKE